MPSLEDSVKSQFAKVFSSKDWSLFKEVAEINLAEAATLKRSSFPSVAVSRQLLVRNIRKRLLIGVGTELLVKAVYLKAGYGINRAIDRAQGPKLPFKLSEVNHNQLEPSDTFTLAQLTDQLHKVVQFAQPTPLVDGLRIAKVFRNKEGHVVTQAHTFDPSSYRQVEAALREIYTYAFGKQLTVRFSFAVGEKGVWRVAP